MNDTQETQDNAITPWVCELSFQPQKELTALFYKEDSKKLQASQLTVGQSFDLKCYGSATLFEKNIKLELKTEKPNVLDSQLIQLKKVIYQDEKQIQWQAVSFIPGKHKADFWITDGKLKVPTHLEWEVQALLAQQPEGYPKSKESVENLAAQLPGGQKAPEPFPPVLGRDMPYPYWLWGVLLGLLLVVFVVLGAFYRRRRKRKEFLLRWNEAQIPYGNYKEFLKQLRSIERKWYLVELSHNECLDLIYQELRTFLFREYCLDDKRKSHSEIEDFFSKLGKRKRKGFSYQELILLMDGIQKDRSDENLKRETLVDYVEGLRLHIEKLNIRSRGSL